MVYHPDHPERRTIYYDDECKLCEGAAKKMKADIDLTVVGASEAPDNIDKESLMREVVAMDEHGELHRGIDAVILILRWHPWGRFMAPLIALPGVKQLAGVIYRVVANNRRRWFGKR